VKNHGLEDCAPFVRVDFKCAEVRASQLYLMRSPNLVSRTKQSVSLLGHLHDEVQDILFYLHPPFPKTA